MSNIHIHPLLQSALRGITPPPAATPPGEIVVDFIYPPIPLRQFDWCAYRADGDEHSPRGWGRTAEDAAADLLNAEDEQ